MLPLINNTVYKTKIPSSGVEIEYRPYFVGEEKIFMMAREAGDQKSIFSAVEQVISNCILTENIDISSLALYDLEYLFIQIRAAAVGEEEVLIVKCENCETENEIEFDFKQDVKVEFPDQSDSHDYSLVELHPSSIKLKLKHPSTEDVKNIGTTGSDVDKMFALFDIVIDRVLTNENVINFKDYPKEDRQKFMERLNPKQIGLIKNFIDRVPKIVGKIDFTCGSCENQNSFEVRGLDGFFTSGQLTIR